MLSYSEAAFLSRKETLYEPLLFRELACLFLWLKEFSHSGEIMRGVLSMFVHFIWVDILCVKGRFIKCVVLLYHLFDFDSWMDHVCFFKVIFRVLNLNVHVYSGLTRIYYYNFETLLRFITNLWIEWLLAVSSYSTRL